MSFAVFRTHYESEQTMIGKRNTLSTKGSKVGTKAISVGGDLVLAHMCVQSNPGCMANGIITTCREASKRTLCPQLTPQQFVSLWRVEVACDVHNSAA